MHMLAKLCPIWAGVFLALLFAAPVQAGDISTVGQFQNGGATAEIDTFNEKGTIVGILVFKSSGKTLTFAFDRNDWPALDKLWRTARQVQGAKFVSAGSLAETGTDEKGVITFAGGPAIRITIVSPIDGAIVFNVPRSMAGEFEAKLRQAASMTTKS
jgi:hypothetical protein